MWRSFAVLALISSMFVAATSTSVGAQQTEPTVADTARLLGHLWADGSYDDGVWDATGPSGGADLIQRLVNVHGGTWINRTQLIFTLPAPYDWAEWKGSLPNDDPRTREAVQHPNFLAALLEGEGSTAGLVYDQSSCCTAGFTNGRLVELRDLLLDRGFSTTTLTMFGDADSGRVNIAASEFAELRQSHEFICPSNGTHIRVPGAENFAAYGSIRWLGSDSAYSDVVRTDCVDGRAITQVSAPVGDCVVTSDGNGTLRLTWSFQRGLATIRRDGNFVTSISAMNYVFVDTPAPGIHAYTVRVTSDGLSRESACGSESTAASFHAAPTAGTLCDGKVVTVMGTGEADEIRATDDVDVIHGYGGADRIAGLKGNDTICGGDGDDTIRGGRGHDAIRGGRGNDTLHGGRGYDTLRGGRGSDTVRGNQGNDTVWGGQSTDELYGGNGIDFLQILDVDTVDGGPGADGCLYETANAEVVSSCETTLTQATAPAFIAALDD